MSYKKFKLISPLILLGVLFSEKFDPLSVQTYKLDNGLTVYLNEDHNTTSVFGAVVVRGGGKRDPKDATGIAHYLEHLLFKGTDKMGTTNYDLEKVYLDSIQIKYDELAQTEDDSIRLALQSEINKLSIKAADFAIPNEFDRLMEEMGGTWINAFTSNDVVCYLNKFPGNQIERWLEVYSHRFVNPVFRLFQSELETVYEEKNRAMDNMFRELFTTYLSSFFKEHPYGQQTVLGSVDHLKNPSLTKMQEYYDTFYVANNMALILSGDIYPDDIKSIIEQKFGTWKSGDLPDPIKIKEKPFNGRELVEKKMTPLKVGMMGYRTVAAGHEDEMILSLCQQLLTNESKTGLIDQLVVDRKIMEAGAFNMDFVDMGAANFFFMPKLFFQSLNKAEKLVIGQVDKLKTGEFDDSFFDAVKLTMIRQHEQNMENMEGRLFSLVDLYTKNQTWEDMINWPNELDKITKADVIEISNKYFGDDYLVLHSKKGSPEKQKLEKPSFKAAIPTNTEKRSEFAQYIDGVSESPLNLQYIEFNDDVSSIDIMDNVHLFHSYNPINTIFNFSMQYGFGNLEDPKLEGAAEILNLLGTTEYTFNEFKSELQKIGTTISFSSDRNYFTINVKGFDKNLDKSLIFLDGFMKNVKGDDSKIKNLVQTAKAARKTEISEPNTVGRALRDYAMWGDNSYYLRRLTAKDIKNLKSKDFLSSFKNALDYEVDIFYSGKVDLETVSSLIQKNITFSEHIKDAKSPKDMNLDKISENTIYLLNDEKAVQSQINFVINGSVLNDEDYTASQAYNKYFGRGMGSLVFQEIREFRSLAYSCGAGYISPFYSDNKGYFNGYIGCQADKTIEAITVFEDITYNMPKKPERMKQITSGLIKGINSNRPSFRRFPSMLSNWLKKGYKEDPRKKRVGYYESMTFKDVINFQKNNISGRSMLITLLTDVERVDMEELKKFGKIVEVNREDILN